MCSSLHEVAESKLFNVFAMIINFTFTICTVIQRNVLHLSLVSLSLLCLKETDYTTFFPRQVSNTSEIFTS